MSHIPPPNKLLSGNKVWAYLRDSGGESQEQSTAQQRKEIEAYCQEYGLILVRVFEDMARSGGSLTGRVEFLEMVDQSYQPYHPDGLLVWNYARFARDMDDSAFYRALLRKNGLVVHSLTDPIPMGDFSRVIESLIDYANEEKRRQNSRDVKRALAERVQSGYSSGGKPPRGYLNKQEEVGTKRNGQPRLASRWIVDSELGPLVTLAFRMRAEGKSLLEITQATHGMLYRMKNSWTTFFNNRSYIGIGKCGKLEVPDHHPALIDPITFKSVQEVNTKARRNAPGNLLHPLRLTSSSLLSGLAICVHCGAAIVKDRAGRNKWNYYICGKKRRSLYHSCEGRQINAAKADQGILDAILTRVLTPKYVTELLEEVKAQFTNIAELDRKVQKALSDLAKIEKSIPKLLDAIEETNSPSAKERLQERESGRARIQFDLSEIQAQREATQLDISPEALSLALAVWRGKIENARQSDDTRELQSLLRQFVSKIEMGYHLARIWYTYPIQALKNTENRSGSLGAPIYRRSLEFSFIVAHRGRQKKPHSK